MFPNSDSWYENPCKLYYKLTKVYSMVGHPGSVVGHKFKHHALHIFVGHFIKSEGIVNPASTILPVTSRSRFHLVIQVRPYTFSGFWVNYFTCRTTEKKDNKTLKVVSLF